jgi:amidase
VELAYELELSLLGADGCRGLEAYAREQGSSELHPLTERGFLSRMRRRAMDVAQFGALWGRWDEYRRNMAQFFRQFDVVLSPVYPDTALPHGASVEEENFRGFSYTMAWNVAGNPAATVCCRQSAGLPVNVQIVTARWRDTLALRVARALEQKSGGWKAPRLFNRHKGE